MCFRKFLNVQNNLNFHTSSQLDSVLTFFSYTSLKKVKTIVKAKGLGSSIDLLGSTVVWWFE